MEKNKNIVRSKFKQFVKERSYITEVWVNDATIWDDPLSAPSLGLFINNDTRPDIEPLEKLYTEWAPENQLLNCPMFVPLHMQAVVRRNWRHYTCIYKDGVWFDAN